ncbi:MAG: formate dehydrogenase accessory sulfurtransferase FdhD [Promethearchaeota archaeon]|nr:MAG: formate dehydrogenase accessory sulfurtransferase FdhD [Candidatus Lokiarchaeota archaeon]
MFKRKVSVTQIKKNQKRSIEDIVLIEKPINFFLNSESLVNIICLPKNLKELTVGFLYSTGIINSLNEIKKIGVNEVKERIDIELNKSGEILSEISSLNPLGRIIDTTCGISSSWRNIIQKSLDSDKEAPLLENKFTIKASMISECIVKMQSETKLFRETGGCHGCAIFDENAKLLTAMEDIGRHNAIDKALGDLLIKKKSFDNVILCSTGRLTGDSVLKAVRARIPIVASISAPIESGIRLAFVYGTTLIGFVRGNRMNIYTHPFRVEL